MRSSSPARSSSSAKRTRPSSRRASRRRSSSPGTPRGRVVQRRAREGRARMRVGRFVLAVALLVCLARAARGAAVRVLSGPGAATAVMVDAMPDTSIEDRTPGAKPAAGPQGPASTGETFTGELTIFLRGLAVSRPAAIEVADPVVSAVRLFPETDGTTVTVFIRQPVTYSVASPSATGEIRTELRSKTRRLQ